MCLHQFLWLAKEHSSHSEKTSIFGGAETAQKLLSKAFETKKLCNCSLQCAVPHIPVGDGGVSPQQRIEYWDQVGVGGKLFPFSLLSVIWPVLPCYHLSSEKYLRLLPGVLG